jgi:uncharacterized protein YdeI (YjbR/CyaY-like superfamily)
MELVRVESRQAWRDWLATNHDSSQGIWLVFPKRHTGGAPLDYESAVEEALCFGWIDSLIRRLDDREYARKFTPRKAGSAWSELNRRRFRKVVSLGIVTAAGLALAPGKRTPSEKAASALRQSSGSVPDYIREALARYPVAEENFRNMAPSYRRLYVLWIDSAKRPETKQRRIGEAIERLTRNLPLGLK